MLHIDTVGWLLLIEFLAVLDLDDALFFHSAEDLDSHHFLFRVQHVFLTDQHVVFFTGSKMFF